MRQLKDVPWEDIREGDFVISLRGTNGKIVELRQKEFATHKEDNEVSILWQNGNLSLIWHFEGNIYYNELLNLVLRNSNEIIGNTLG